MGNDKNIGGFYSAAQFSAAFVSGEAFAVSSAAIAMGIAGGITGAITTGTLKGALLGALQGAATIGFGGALSGALGEALGSAAAGRLIGQGLVGGLFSAAGGGNFGSGFLAAGFATLATPGGAGYSTKNLVISAITGGVGSVLGGGKFANGAATGAFAYIATSIAQSAAQGSARGVAPDTAQGTAKQLPSTADVARGGWDSLFGGSLWDVAAAVSQYTRAGIMGVVGQAYDFGNYLNDRYVSMGITDYLPDSDIIIYDQIQNSLTDIVENADFGKLNLAGENLARQVNLASYFLFGTGVQAGLVGVGNIPLPAGPNMLGPNGLFPSVKKPVLPGFKR